MGLAERDAYVVTRLAALKAQGLGDRQAVLELIRTGGVANLTLPGFDLPALEADTAGLQTAVADISTTATRTMATAEAAITINSPGKSLHQNTDKNSYRVRAVAAGA